MKRFKVSSNDSNKLTAQDFEFLATKLAAVNPPPKPLKPLPKIQDLMEGLKRASKLHGSGAKKDTTSELANAGGLLYLSTKLLETVGQTTGLGSLLGPGLQWAATILLLLKAADLKTQKLFAMRFGKNTLLRDFDKRPFEIRKYASEKDLAAPTRITSPFSIENMTLEQVLETYNKSVKGSDNAWTDGTSVYTFANDSDVREIQNMIKINASARTQANIAKFFAIAGVPGFIGLSEAIRDNADKKARESPTGQAVKSEGSQVAPLTTDPSKISPSLQQRLKQNPAKSKDKVRTQQYPNRNQ